jgi:hypothetical protein
MVSKASTQSTQWFSGDEDTNFQCGETTYTGNCAKYFNCHQVDQEVREKLSAEFLSATLKSYAFYALAFVVFLSAAIHSYYNHANDTQPPDWAAHPPDAPNNTFV